ncbi:MAG: helix-turn-helix domain-containing protein [Planctomycetota bacterium]
MNNEPLVSAGQVADHFGVCVGTVNAWVRERRIPCVRPSRRVVRFHLSEVEAALRQDMQSDDTEKAAPSR